jgi:N-acetylglucosaminyl-diphospho-decaprenol L-rhamnosyltransferase
LGIWAAVDDLCAVVVCHDGRRWLDAALSSIEKHAGGLALDVVVVDNGSDGSAAEVERNWPAVRVIRCPGRSFSHAKNQALETAAARYALFLNADIEVLEGSIGALVADLDQRPDIALVGARQLRGDGELALTIRRFPSGLHMLAEALGAARLPWLRRVLGEREHDVRQYDRERLCDWTSGFMLVRGTSLDAVGWFDERFFLFSDETDFCWRLRRAGWKVIHSPRITVRRRERDRRESTWMEAQVAYARMQFARKRFPPVAVEYRWVLALRYALRIGLYSLGSRKEEGRRRAARAALRTVLRGQDPLDERSAF